MVMHISTSHPDAGAVRLAAAAPLLNANRSTPLRLIMRWKWRILAFACAVTLVSVIWHLKPRYSAESTVTIDVRQMRVINQEGLLSSPMLDESLVRSDMEAFDSINLARSVVTVLNLNRNPDFCGSSPGCNAPVDEAAKKLMGVTATNDGRSYIIRIRAEVGDGDPRRQRQRLCQCIRRLPAADARRCGQEGDHLAGILCRSVARTIDGGRRGSVQIP